MDIRTLHDCLADLDRLVSLRPAYATSTATTRAFCEMLAGRCQQGKKRLTTYWREEQNMHPERAATTMRGYSPGLP